MPRTIGHSRSHVTKWEPRPRLDYRPAGLQPQLVLLLPRRHHTDTDTVLRVRAPARGDAGLDRRACAAGVRQQPVYTRVRACLLPGWLTSPGRGALVLVLLPPPMAYAPDMPPPAAQIYATL